MFTLSERHEQLGRSVKHALDRGFDLPDVLPFAIISGAVLLLGLGSHQIWKHRHSIQRRLTYYRKRISGVASPTEKRFEAKTSVAIILPFPHKPTERTYTVNLSSGGMYVKMLEPYEVNTTFEFLLHLDDEEKIRGTALVRWRQQSWSEQHPSGMGCEFLDLSDEDRQKLKAFIKKQPRAF